VETVFDHADDSFGSDRSGASVDIDRAFTFGHGGHGHGAAVRDRGEQRDRVDRFCESPGGYQAAEGSADRRLSCAHAAHFNDGRHEHPGHAAHCVRPGPGSPDAGTYGRCDLLRTIHFNYIDARIPAHVIPGIYGKDHSSQRRKGDSGARPVDLIFRMLFKCERLINAEI